MSHAPRQTEIPPECRTDNHVVGQIGTDEVRRAAWADQEAAFVAVVEDFNLRGQRQEISHPGWVTWFKFCPCCGANNGAQPDPSADWQELTPR